MHSNSSLQIENRPTIVAFDRERDKSEQRREGQQTGGTANYVILAELLLSFTGAAGARVARRMLYERIIARNLTRKKAVAVLLIGAGRSGVNAANQLRAAGTLRPVGFLDDDPKKTGLLVAGLKVLGPVSLLSSLVPKHRVEQVIPCIPSPPASCCAAYGRHLNCWA